MDDDAELLRRLTDGDRTAFEAIVRRHVDFVYATARRRVGDAHLAEDVTQAVFLILMQKAASIAGRAVLVGWLHRTVGHVASNAMKRQRRREHHERRASAERSDRAMPDESVDETLQQLDAAIGRPRDKSRDAILLRFFRKLTFAEVGKVLGISDEAAKKRVTRAVEELRGTLAGATSAAAVVAMLEATPSQAAPAALLQTIFNTPAPSAAATGLAKGTFVTISTKSVAAAVVAAALIGGIAVVATREPSATPVAKTSTSTSAPTPIPISGGTLVGALFDVSVELLAIGDPADARWWTAAGDANVPQPSGGLPILSGTYAGTVRRGIVAAMNVTPNENGDVTTRAKLVDAAATVTSSAGVDGRTHLQVVAAIPTSRPTTLQIEVASGPWLAVATLDVGAPTSRPVRGDPAWIGLRESLADAEGGVEAKLWLTSGDDDLRVVAVDHAGRETVMSPTEFAFEPLPRGTPEDQLTRVTVAGRQLRARDIAAIRVDTRPFDHTIEFRDLATARDAPTSPSVVVR